MASASKWHRLTAGFPVLNPAFALLRTTVGKIEQMGRFTVVSLHCRQSCSTTSWCPQQGENTVERAGFCPVQKHPAHIPASGDRPNCTAGGKHTHTHAQKHRGVLSDGSRNRIMFRLTTLLAAGGRWETKTTRL